MLSHQLKQFKIDGEKTIIQNPNDAQKKEHEKYTLEAYEVIKSILCIIMYNQMKQRKIYVDFFYSGICYGCAG